MSRQERVRKMYQNSKCIKRYTNYLGEKKGILQYVWSEGPGSGTIMVGLLISDEEPSFEASNSILSPRESMLCYHHKHLVLVFF